MDNSVVRKHEAQSIHSHRTEVAYLTSSLMVLNKLNIVSGIPAADWLSQRHAKNYCNFSCVMMQLFSVMEIPVKHSSLHNK